MFIVVFLLTPVIAAANHNDNRNGWDVDRDRLDEDVVGLFSVPVLFGVQAIASNYGDPRGGGTRSHEGQDIMALKGSPIVSPTEAIVIRTGEGESAGKYVYTANPGGETFRYMHLDEVADINRGDRLKIGDFIGTNGDTGNAPDGAYHLHLEVRDEDNKATDPYPRLDGEFSLQEKMSFMEGILEDYDGDEEEYATFLVENFKSDFTAGFRAGYDLPDEIVEALADTGVVSEQAEEQRLAETLAQIPPALTLELETGDQSLLVTLLQIYIIYTSEGVARNELAAVGATGYYGSLTAAAVQELQAKLAIEETGKYDKNTRRAAIDRDPVLSLR